jgi:FkbM family methyltransferase
MRRDGLFMPFVYDPLKHIYKLVKDAEYRRYHWLVTRYGRSPRYTPRLLTVQGWKLTVPDIASFLSAYREIFVEGIYAFRSDSADPIILDCGANIGLAILYFKSKYPSCKVVAYEADPHIYRFLTSNIMENGFCDVELHNCAVWSSDGYVNFDSDRADGGHIARRESATGIKVASRSLEGILREKQYDFIKLDIEGAETESIKGCEELLSRNKYVFIEFHSFKDRRQDLGQLILAFEQHGFRSHVHPPNIAKSPFLGIADHDGMDMQLNLFFWKE